MNNHPTEQEIRAMRDAIYGKGSDHNWEACKENWMKPSGIAWLEKQVKNLPTKPNGA